MSHRRDHAHVRRGPRDRGHRPRRDDGSAGRSPRRPEQRRQQLQRHGLRRRGGRRTSRWARPPTRALQAAGRPAVALRRHQPARHLDAAGAGPLRGRRRDAAGAGACRPRRRSATSTRRRQTPSIASGPANPTSSTSAQFAFGSNDGGATFECRLDGAAYEPCPANMTFGGLAFGTHTVNARAIDGSENEDASPASYSWLIALRPTRRQPAASFVLAPAEDAAGRRARRPLQRGRGVRVRRAG